MTDGSFESFMQQRQRVAQAFVNGNAEPLGAISTGSDPATLFGPRGGVEQGARNVLTMNEEGAQAFLPGGTTELEVLHQGHGGDLGYWTGLQHATVVSGPDHKSVQMTLRVTEVFRRESGGWKLVHRHADTLTQPSREDG